MEKVVKNPTYNGKPTSLVDFARLKGCNHRVVYRYFEKHGSLDRFDEWRENHPRKVKYKGELLTFNQAAERLGVTAGAARRFYNRYGNLNGCGEPHANKLRLHRSYFTLDPSIPLDRCIAAAGYRSIRQFCKANDLSDSLVGCWRRGRLSMYAGYLGYLPRQHRRPTLLDEMTNFKRGFSIPLAKIMAGTGCLEWELFPDIFTQDFYDAVYKGQRGDSCAEVYKDTAIERNEMRRAIRAVLHTLPDRTREVLELAFGMGSTCAELTYGEIGRRYRLTKERVRQILARAMRMLRTPSRMKVLREVCPFLTFWEKGSPLIDVTGGLRRMTGLP